MGRYAEGTSVPVERSESEARRLIKKYGGDNIIVGSSDEESLVFLSFRKEGRYYKIEISLPNLNDKDIKYSVSGRVRSPEDAQAALDKEAMRRWRVLVLWLKAKLETVESGLFDFQTEFLPHLMLSDGNTVRENLSGQIEEHYNGATIELKLLPAGR